MRCTQPIGHTADVTLFLETCEKMEKIGVATGMFEEDVFDLHAYKDEDGNIWEEFLQASPWSSGPLIFLGIRNRETCEEKGWMSLDYPPYEGFEYSYEEGTFYV